MKLRFSTPVFTGRLHDARTATSIGRWLGAAFAVCFVTGLISHFMQHPPDWAAGGIPSRPSWGYRLTQGLHVASGIAATPLLLAKLWTVYPRLFEWPPLRSPRHALERASVAVLVAGSVFELTTGLLNTVQWYPWPFSFVPVHYAVGWLVTGALLLHIAVKAPRIGAHWRRRSPGTLALPARDAADRRSLLTAVGASVGAVTLTTVGQSFTPLKAFLLFAPRHPDRGPQGLPVNRTAAAAGSRTGSTACSWPARGRTPSRWTSCARCRSTRWSCRSPVWRGGAGPPAGRVCGWRICWSGRARPRRYGCGWCRCNCAAATGCRRWAIGTPAIR